VVHRDLKPANIFLSDDGRLKVGDFGLARDHDSERLTIDGQTVGTAKYLAPEQAMAKPDIDGRADLYSLGCILFEMMAGRTPFTSDEPHGAVNYVQLMRKHVEMQPPSLSDFVVGCPPALAAFISRLLVKNPDDRPKSAAEVSRILAEIIRDPLVEPCKVGRQAELEVPELRSLTERLHETTESSRQVNAKAMIAIATITFIGLAIFWVFKQNK
jgi:serine/threonine protein kinase